MTGCTWVSNTLKKHFFDISLNLAIYLRHSTQAQFSFCCQNINTLRYTNFCGKGERERPTEIVSERERDIESVREREKPERERERES